MTPEQGEQLKAGDPVEYRVTGLVHRVQYNFGHPNAVVLRRTSDAHGRQPLMLCALANVHLTPAIDPATATDAVILADWLEDQGESEAAHKLRQHFGPTVGLDVPTAEGEQTDNMLPYRIEPRLSDDRITDRSEVDEQLSEHAKADLEYGAY